MDDGMRIAYIHDAVYPFVKGGAERRLYELSRRLARRGHEVHIFGMRWWGREPEMELEGVHLHGVCRAVPLYSRGRRSIRAAVTFARSVLPHLAREKFDVIDCYQAPYLHAFPAKFGALLKGTPLAVTWHEVWRGYWGEYLGSLGVVGRAMERAILLGLADRVIAVSEQTRDDLVSLGVDADRISVVPNGIDFDAISKVSPSQERLDVVYLGRLIRPKNVDVLLRAAAILKEEFPELRVGVIGDGPERGNLEKLADELGIRKNVEFFGFVEDFNEVVALMKSSKVFVIPSTQEGGASIVTLEANACGLPVIAVDHPLGIDKRLILEGKTGFFVKLSPENMAEKIQLLLRDERLRSGMGADAVKFSQTYDWERIAGLLEQAYSNICR
ncbi:MAG: glycosyltransferase family 4 protein [Candidatus Hadarchaeum sp.]|uniref:glycosyltransferase family 4 protein n=1 Tax=Candidatus Hadarchaeum sp. TaxID=2883567 RepID=UPI003D0BEF8C